jgi:uncharacterized membrane protein
MKKFPALFAAALLTLAIGCDKASTPGGPGVNHPDGKAPMVGQADATFQLSAPMLSTKVNQGETKTATLNIKRGKNFDQDVTVKFGDLPKGVTITPTSAILKHGENEMQISISAAADAAIGDFSIGVTGSPDKGANSATSITIAVAKS